MTYKKKLIEVAIPLAKINEESAREKSIRHGHPSTLHLWWARRPLAAARAVLFAQLVDDPSSRPNEFPTEEAQAVERKRLFDLMERLVPWESSNDPSILAEAHAEILKSCDGELPKVLDPFGGGGAIPLESLRLGLPTYSGDLNPVAVLIQKAMLEIPQRFGGRPPVNPDALDGRAIWTGAEGLSADVEAYGRWMQAEANKRIGQYYPDVQLEDGSTSTPIAWIWARTVQSPDPSWPGHVPLVRSWILSKKAGKPTIWVEPIVDRDRKTITYEIREGGTPFGPTVERGNAKCLATGVSISLAQVDELAAKGELRTILLAVVCEGADGGRSFVKPSDAQLGASSSVPTLAELELMTTLPHGRTRGTFGGNAQGRYYGFFDYCDYFTPRQLLALTTFSDLLSNIRSRVVADAERVGFDSDGVCLRDGGRGAEAYADAIVTYLAFVIDRGTDYWSTIATWTPYGFVAHTFGRQAIPMTWDFAEVNPFSGATGSWDSAIGWVTRAIRILPTEQSGDVQQRDARARIAEVGECVISTDPPYYDNISYADLSDFFYVWLRRNLNGIWTDETSTLLTPKSEELIANQYRAGSKDAANEHFESGMEEVFAAAAANADPRFPAAIFYAFKAAEISEEGAVSTGWETFLAGLLHAGYSIEATWPVRTERVTGLKGRVNMLASSIVLACRPRHVDSPMATRGEFIAALHREMVPAVRLLQEQNIAPVDMAQSAMGPGISIFSRFAKVVEADGSAMTVRTALLLINEVLAETLSGEESEFDPDTRFALTWFEQFGHNPAAYGDADVLARAKNTSVEGVQQAGIVTSRDGKVRLVERSELDVDWDPTTDTRLTVWETTQYLIRALDSSESEAADLLRRMGGGMGDRARQLAYLLYGICDRKRWADEASPYNMLVTAWPEIERLANAAPLDEFVLDDDRLF